MSIISMQQIRRMAKGKVNQANANSIIVAINTYGPRVGLDQPHRLAQFLPQVMHESGSFKWDREIWGPTAAQKRYEGRADLGNTQPGDGKKFSGKGPIQLTGRDNTTRFSKWAKSIDPNAPDFVEDPDLINSDPWEGLSAIWYWTEGNPERKSLNRYADQNNIEMITRRINGGLNGYGDRLEYYDRVALVLLGYDPARGLRAFQEAAKARGDYKGDLDGLPGPKSRAAMHLALVRLTSAVERDQDVKAAPVAEEKPVAVPVKELEKPGWQSPEVLIPAITPILAPLMTFLGGLDWRVAIALFVVLAGFAAFLIVRRDRMKATQAATVQRIEANEVGGNVRLA